MTTTVNVWRVECVTEGKTYEVKLYDYEAAPVKCPNEDATSVSAHTIRGVRVLRQVSDINSKIIEETTPTGGHFRERTVTLICPPGEVTVMNAVYPIPIGALSMEFVTEEIHRGDMIEVYVGKDTPVGVIMANAAGTDIDYNNSTEYSVNTVVKYTHPDPDYGPRVYTKIKASAAGTHPLDAIGRTNREYWQHGFPLLVSPTVFEHVNKGHLITLKNVITQQTEELGMVLDMDKNNNRIFVKNNPTLSHTVFLNNNPALTSGQPITLVLVTVLVMEKHEMGPPWEQVIGTSKIGASHVPEDIKVNIHYHNRATTGDPKTLVGRVDFLY